MVLPLGCARFGQPMADPVPPPEAVGAGPSLSMINTDESQSALESASGDRVGSSNPSYNTYGASLIRPQSEFSRASV